MQHYFPQFLCCTKEDTSSAASVDSSSHSPIITEPDHGMEISLSPCCPRRITVLESGAKVVASIFWHPDFSSRSQASFATESIGEYETLSIIFSYIAG